MAVTQNDIDQDALDRVMALSRARTKKDAVNPRPEVLRRPTGTGRPICFVATVASAGPVGARSVLDRHYLHLDARRC